MIPNDMMAIWLQYDCRVSFAGFVTGNDPDLCMSMWNVMEAVQTNGQVLNPYDLYRKIPDES